MILRSWRGWTAREDAGRYLAFLSETGVKDIEDDAFLAEKDERIDHREILRTPAGA